MEKLDAAKASLSDKEAPPRLPYEAPKLTQVAPLFELVGRGAGSHDATAGRRITP
jgi:hypothetical protein